MNNDDFYQKLRKTFRDWLSTDQGKNYKWSDYLLFAPDLFHVLCKVLADKDTPMEDKAKIAGAVAYFISPIDLLPEAVLGPIGYADDIILAAYVLNSVINKSGPEIVRRHWAGDEDVLRVISQVLESADEMVGSGLWRKLKGKFSSERTDKGETDLSVKKNDKRSGKSKKSENYEGRKYRVEKTASSLKVYDRRDNREVFSYVADDEPVYIYDRPDRGESGYRTSFYIESYSVSDDERYISLNIADYNDKTKGPSLSVFDIETGRRI